MFDFTSGSVQSRGIAFFAKLFMFQLGSGFFIDTSFVILHFALLVFCNFVLANEINVGILSAWHSFLVRNERKKSI